MRHLLGKKYPNRRGRSVMEETTGLTFPNVRRAADHFNLSDCTVGRRCDDGKDHNGLIFKRLG